ncbi:glycerate kinase [Fusobacterium simiae]|uniref:Glycerate kinase n=2 Tax=Fusobacterium TaxID=848 RepID=F9EN97_9FUSO|nr:MULTISPECIES: glycerate kinase [Fusobacterium]EGQ79568.1 glycerate kinase [Fusobacterium animalis ATCC 51191]MCY7007474.1 glycerate kinase [Fusobacterium simiae]
MKIVVAPDSFKESMSAKEVCDSIEKGLLSVSREWEIVKVPMADGGEGTLEALVDATNGKIFSEKTLNPLGEEITSQFGILGGKNIAIIEMASTSGLELISPEKRNPYITTTYGTGQLMLRALEQNVEEIILGIGGSATNDGGAGMLQALGAKLLDKNGDEIGFGGYELSKLNKIDFSNLDKRLKKVKILVACDVTNPLTGENGSSYIFGKQKGATPEMIEVLDKNLLHYSEIIKRDLGFDVNNIPGAGAAGGLGAGLLTLGAILKKGIEIVIEANELDKRIQGADLVITGEGSIDGQTRFGKTPYGVVSVAKKYNIPTITLAGNVGKDIDILYDYGFDTIFSIMQGVDTLENALKNGKDNIERTAKNIGHFIKIFK